MVVIIVILIIIIMWRKNVSPSPMPSALSSFRSLRKTTPRRGEKYDIGCIMTTFFILNNILWDDKEHFKLVNVELSETRKVIPIVVNIVREYIRELENVHRRAPGLKICSQEFHSKSKRIFNRVYHLSFHGKCSIDNIFFVKGKVGTCRPV